MSYFDTALAFAAPVVFCIFVVAFVEERGLLSRVLVMKPFQFMAELSFSIYMVHAIILIFGLAMFHEIERMSGVKLFMPEENPLVGHPGVTTTIQVLHIDATRLKWTIGCGYVFCVLLASYAAYRYVEVPSRALFGTLAKRVGKAPARSRSSARAGTEPMEPAP